MSHELERAVNEFTPVEKSFFFEQGKTCPSCKSFFITKKECQSCGIKFDQDFLGKPFGEKSFYVKGNDFWSYYPVPNLVYSGVIKDDTITEYKDYLKRRAKILIRHLLSSDLKSEFSNPYFLEFSDLMEEYVRFFKNKNSLLIFFKREGGGKSQIVLLNRLIDSKYNENIHQFSLLSGVKNKKAVRPFVLILILFFICYLLLWTFFSVPFEGIP